MGLYAYHRFCGEHDLIQCALLLGHITLCLLARVIRDKEGGGRKGQSHSNSDSCDQSLTKLTHRMSEGISGLSEE